MTISTGRPSAAQGSNALAAQVDSPVWGRAHSATFWTSRRGLSGALVLGVLVMGGLGLTGCSGPSSSAGLPSGYPSSEVPLASTSVVASSSVGAGWDVTVKVSDANAQKAALTALQKKGFTIFGQSQAGTDTAAYSLANATYSVRLGFGNDKTNGYTVEYGVAVRAGVGSQSSSGSQSTQKASEGPKASAAPSTSSTGKAK